MTTRRLVLRSETLAELTPAELLAIPAAAKRDELRINVAAGDLGAAHTARCAFGCTCYCG